MAFSLKNIFPWLSEPAKTVSPDYPILKKGNKNEYVGILQGQLASQGFYQGGIDNDFGSRTESALNYFQQTHLDSKKNPLKVTGIVDKDTWWALFNPHTIENKISKSNKLIPNNLSSERQKTLTVAETEFRKPVKEIPDGSNWGPDVKKYLQFCGLGPNPWCLAFIQWVIYNALGFLPWKSKTAHVATFYNLCKKLGMAHSVASGYKPKPGDLFIIIHGDDTGHIGIIARVGVGSTQLNVIEGNSSNRVALRTRTVGDNSHVGYVNPFGDELKPYDFEYGLIGNTDNSGIGSTR
jgi:hypothetical protein